MKIVYVKGNVLIYTSKFVYADITAGTNVDIEKVFSNKDINNNVALELIEGDLIIDDNYKSSMFTYYFATKGVVASTIGISKWPGMPYFILKILDDEMFKIKRIYNLRLDDELLYDTLYKQSFVSLITVYEVFMTELLFSFVFNNEEIFDLFQSKVKTFIKDKIIPGHKPQSNIFNRVDCENLCYYYIHNVRYQELNKIRILYEELFNITFPKCEKLKSHIKMRNDIVHRNGHDVDGIYYKITKEKLDEVETDISLFISDICNEFKINRDFDITSQRGCDYILNKYGVILNE